VNGAALAFTVGCWQPERENPGARWLRVRDALL